MKLALQVFVDLFLLFGLFPVHVFLAPVLYILELTDEGQGICLTPPKPVLQQRGRGGGGGLQCKKATSLNICCKLILHWYKKICKHVTQISDKIQFSKLFTCKLTQRNTCCIAKSIYLKSFLKINVFWTEYNCALCSLLRNFFNRLNEHIFSKRKAIRESWLSLKGLSHEIDFDNIGKNWQM
jgi:hypothetical protein